MDTCMRHVTLQFRDRSGAKLRSITEIARKSAMGFVPAQKLSGIV